LHKRGQLAYSKILTLGGVPASLSVSPYLWSVHGEGPVWLLFEAGSSLAKAAFSNACKHTYNGVAVPVPLATESTEQEVVDVMVTWLGGAAAKLALVRQLDASPISEDDTQDDVDEV
jgi:hypothetical protein